MARERELVQGFADRARELEALEALEGAVTARHLRTLQLTEPAYAALVEGLCDDQPRVRWWCVQVLDHVPDDRALHAIATVLNDPVARVRRNAAHALGCVACKPGRRDRLPQSVAATLRRMADRDPNAKVRAAAQLALTHTTGFSEDPEPLDPSTTVILSSPTISPQEGPATVRCVRSWCIDQGGLMGDKSPKKPNAKKPGKSLKEKRAEKQLKHQANKRPGTL